MERMEVYLWLVTIEQAKKGDQKCMEYVRVENKIRKEQGRPSLEEELLAIAEGREQLKEHPSSRK